jgi:hypothetical protein
VPSRTAQRASDAVSRAAMLGHRAQRVSSAVIRAAARGHTVPCGGVRSHSTYYRDSSLAFRAALVRNTWNVTNVITIVWP